VGIVNQNERPHTMDSSNRMRNELVGSWHTLTGQSEKLAGELLDDPNRYFNGVVTALQGQLEETIGDSQAQVAGEALRSQWSGLSQETKGQVLKQWGEWTDDPDTMANGIVDLAQGKLDRYTGSAMRQDNASLGSASMALSDDTAERARQALASLFADRIS
jgi:uncharacterized protein YjbJ (UPF0337 family)